MLLALAITAIVGGTVVDGTGAPPRRVTVIVRDSRIEAVGPDLPIPPGANVVDAGGKTLLPGLFDLHTHSWTPALAGAGTDWGKHWKAYLYCGVTTIVDVGNYPEMFEPVRRLTASGMAAPRIHLAARFSSPGGHGLEGGRGDFHTQGVLTPREARAAVRRILPYKPDLLKVFTDGWRYGTDTDMTSMDESTLKALVEEAHQNGLKVVTHTVTVDKAKIAARAGVDVVIHGLGDASADDELLGLMKSKGTAYVQTLAVYDVDKVKALQANPLAAQYLPADVLAKLTASKPGAAALRRQMRLLENCKRMRDAGILLGAGTDNGMPTTVHGYSSLRELELMVTGGLTPLEALTAATGGSAQALGVGKERGTIAAGRLADLVLVDGAPQEDIRDIYKIARVWLGGIEVDRPALLAAMKQPGPTPLPAKAAPRLLDDFESPNGRSRLDTLWLNATDGGHDHSLMTYERTARQAGNHTLTVLAEMGEKDRPYASMVLPLSRGAVEPVDARSWKGVEFEVRGEGEYRLLRQHRGALARDAPESKFTGTPQWKRVRLPLGPEAADLTALEFRIDRPARQKAWIEIDNLRFYR